ncbi:hypothetical protein HAX54_049109 [Datura stramonium]|uniref:Uncharacterized protein n=1 Tax=Datura stramonium TaxID=4076 RepID=A0ABS8WK50_DATST|nr:hypothetical protein [Datura stramonium]
MSLPMSSSPMASLLPLDLLQYIPADDPSVPSLSDKEQTEPSGSGDPKTNLDSTTSPRDSLNRRPSEVLSRRRSVGRIYSRKPRRKIQGGVMRRILWIQLSPKVSSSVFHRPTPPVNPKVSEARPSKSNRSGYSFGQAVLVAGTTERWLRIRNQLGCRSDENSAINIAAAAATGDGGDQSGSTVTGEGDLSTSPQSIFSLPLWAKQLICKSLEKRISNTGFNRYLGIPIRIKQETIVCHLFQLLGGIAQFNMAA